MRAKDRQIKMVKARKTRYATKKMPFTINCTRAGRMKTIINQRKKEFNRMASPSSESRNSRRRSRRSGPLLRAATYQMFKTHPTKLQWPPCLLIGLLAVIPILPPAANAQAPESQGSTLAPPVNHETGRIEKVLTGSDDGYRFREYVLAWRSTHIVVAGSPDESRSPGDDLDVVVYRSEVNGRKVLRFESRPSDSNEDVVDFDSTASTASITLGTARIEDTVSADSDGYQFAGYFVTWHDQRVFIVDPQSTPTRAIGETINFRVVRTGAGSSRRLSFSL
jgi:hypothetical protein